MYDLISIGDSVIDAFTVISEAEVLCQLDNQDCRLCLSYSDKIPVEKFKLTTAGNAMNNAVGSSRLGLKTALYTEIGNDMFGKMIVDKMMQEKISTDYVNLNKGSETNLHTVISYKVERTILVYHTPRNYKLPAFENPPKWIYYTSVSKGFESLQNELLAYLNANPSVKMAFNPATYHLRAGLDALREVIKRTEVLFINREEAKRLLSIDLKQNTPMKELLSKVHELGPKVVVITDGPKGSTAFNGSEFFQLGLYDVPIVERTGVGDAFATGFVAAQIYEKSLEDSLKWGTLNSAGVIQEIGPQDGLQTKGQVEKIMNANPQFLPVDLL